MLSAESKKGSVREETNAVSGTTVMSVQKPTPKTAPPSEPPTPRGRRASRKRSLRGRSPSGKTSRQPCKNFLQGTCTKLPCDCWHPPECQFYKSQSGGRLRNNRIIGRRRGVTKVKMHDSWVVYGRTSSRQNL